MMRLYLDASAIIYVVEGDAERRLHVEQAIAATNAAGAGTVITSELSCIECRVKPMRLKDAALLADYESLLDGSRFRIVGISREVIDDATRLRADLGFKIPDAIHLATARIHGADAILTGDRELRRCPGMRVELVP